MNNCESAQGANDNDRRQGENTGSAGRIGQRFTERVAEVSGEMETPLAGARSPRVAAAPFSVNVAEFPIRVEGGNPLGVASGAGTDKNVWFTLSSSNIGMINPSNPAPGSLNTPSPPTIPDPARSRPGPMEITGSSSRRPTSSASSTRPPGTSPRFPCRAAPHRRSMGSPPDQMGRSGSPRSTRTRSA